MDRISEKLHSTRGASMLIALLYLLVALTVGAVVLTAASAAAGRTARNLKEQQNYLAVASAVELIKADMEKAEFVGEYKEIVEEWDTSTQIGTDENNQPIYKTEHHVQTSYSKSTAMTGSALLKEAEDDFTALYSGTLGIPALDEPAPGDMNYELHIEADNRAVSAVQGSRKVWRQDDADSGMRRYTVIDTLFGGTADDCNNTTTIKFVPQVTTNRSVEIIEDSRKKTTTTYTTTVTWGDPLVIKGAAT